MGWAIRLFNLSWLVGLLRPTNHVEKRRSVEASPPVEPGILERRARIWIARLISWRKNKFKPTTSLGVFGMCSLGCVLWDVFFGMSSLGCVLWDVFFGMCSSGCLLWEVFFGMCSLGCVLWDVFCVLWDCFFGLFSVYLIFCIFPELFI